MEFKNINRFFVRDGHIYELVDEVPADYLIEKEEDLEKIAPKVLPGSIASLPNGLKSFRMSPNGVWAEIGVESDEEAERFTVAAVGAEETLFGHTVSDLQTDVFVADGKITGTIKYVSSGALVSSWGAGNFIALQFSGEAFTGAKHIYVGMDPSAGSGLVDVIDDPDRNGVFKITNKNQKFKAVVDYGTYKTTYLYDLTGLTLSTN